MALCEEISSESLILQRRYSSEWLKRGSYVLGEVVYLGGPRIWWKWRRTALLRFWVGSCLIGMGTTEATELY